MKKLLIAIAILFAGMAACKSPKPTTTNPSTTDTTGTTQTDTTGRTKPDSTQRR